MGAILDRIRAQGLERVLLYCNSLSATIDARALAEPRGLRIWTPMDVMARSPEPIAGWAFWPPTARAPPEWSGHGERLAGDSGPGAANLALVQGVEAGTPPEILVEDCGLETLLRFLRAKRRGGGGPGLHPLPYVKAALQRRTDLPVLDPSERLASWFWR